MLTTLLAISSPLYDDWRNSVHYNSLCELNRRFDIKEQLDVLMEKYDWMKENMELDDWIYCADRLVIKTSNIWMIGDFIAGDNKFDIMDGDIIQIKVNTSIYDDIGPDQVQAAYADWQRGLHVFNTCIGLCRHAYFLNWTSDAFSHIRDECPYYERTSVNYSYDIATVVILTLTFVILISILVIICILIRHK